MEEECCAYIDAEVSIRFPFRNKLQMLIETLGANLEKILDPRVVPTCLIFIADRNVDYYLKICTEAFGGAGHVYV